jgi:hypothetical protein
MSTHHLAQLNVALPRFSTDDPRMAGFMSLLDEINALADGSPGFVWRLVSEGGNDATALRAPLDGGEQLINMSVWEGREALWSYVYRSAHLDVMRRRSEWFESPAGAALVLWWHPAGRIPTIEEGLARLDMLRRHGASLEAFTFRQDFPQPLVEPR